MDPVLTMGIRTMIAGARFVIQRFVAFVSHSSRISTLADVLNLPKNLKKGWGTFEDAIARSRTPCPKMSTSFLIFPLKKDVFSMGCCRRARKGKERFRKGAQGLSASTARRPQGSVRSAREIKSHRKQKEKQDELQNLRKLFGTQTNV